MPNRPFRGLARLAAMLLLACAVAGQVAAQPAPSGPPAVGVIEATRRPITESYEFIGRVQAIHRVDLVARVAAFLEDRLFTEGAEVKAGELLYRLERGPYEADLAAKQAAVAQAEAELINARATLARARDLRSTGAGTQVALDNAIAQERSANAQALAAQAQMRQSQINLDYTEIRAPIDGRIGRTAVTVGNVVGPNSRCPGDDRERGSDVCHFPGPDAHRPGVARPLCEQGRVRGGGDPAAPAEWPPLRTDREAGLRRYRCQSGHRYADAPRHHPEPRSPRREGR
ncbi:efflux RND transporter periplasmic adaptor subunit [Siccirubricoccus sp. G192]|nr:efflux RND transporter periplasmic adaptor subunit [Siccirubricoccus sp. G192]